MSATVGSAWSDRTSTVSTDSPRRAARRARLSRSPRPRNVESRSGYTQTTRRLLSEDTVQLRSDVLEGRVVGDHLEAPRRNGPHRLVEGGYVPERHIVDFESHREV